MRKSLALILLAGLCAGGCLVSARVSSLGYVELAVSSNASRIDAGIATATSESELRTLWSDAGLFTELPEIDFRRDMVVAYFMGARATGGYSTRVVDLEGGPARAKLHVRNTAPARSCPVTLATTSPVVLIRTGRLATVMLGDVESAIRHCN